MRASEFDVRQSLRMWKTSECLTYKRCSTDRQDASLPDQEQAIRTEMRRLGLTTVRAAFEDDGLRGHDETRPGLLSILEFVRTNPNRGIRMNVDFIPILVYDLSRFGRFDDPKRVFKYFIEVEEYGYEFYSITERIRSRGNIADWVTAIVKSGQASDFTVNIGRLALRTGTELARAGFWPGGQPPYGFDRLAIAPDGTPRCRYVSMPGKRVEKRSPDGRTLLSRIDPIEDKGRLRSQYSDKLKGDRVKLVPNAERARVVKDVFTHFVEKGWGLRRIAQHLNEQGIPPARGSAWCAGTIRGILVNPNYTSQLLYGKRSDSKYFDFDVVKTNDEYTVHIEKRDIPQRVFVHRKREECIVIKNGHQSLISERTWQSAQEALKARRVGLQPTGQGTKSPYLLSGLIECQCGYRFQGDKHREHRTYICGGFHTGSSNCRRTAIPAEFLEEKILEGIRRRLFDGYLFTSVDELAKEIQRQLAGPRTAAGDVDSIRVLYEAKAAELHRKHAKLAALDEEMRSLALEGLKGLEREVQVLQGQLRAAEAIPALPARKPTRVEAKDIANRLWELGSLLNDGTPEERKQFIRCFVQGITIENRKEPYRITARYYKHDGLRELADVSLQSIPRTGNELKGNGPPALRQASWTY